MKLEFQRKPKTQMTGVRLTVEEHEAVALLAKQNDESIPETIRVLVHAALKENNLIK